MNEQIMKKLLSGIHGLVPYPPKIPIVGKEKSQLISVRGRLALVSSYL